VGGPAGVSDGDLGEESLLLVDGRIGNLLAETGHLADLLEEDHITRFVTIDTDACRSCSCSRRRGSGSSEQEQEQEQESGSKLCWETETDRQSRSLCTLGAPVLGIGFRRSSVDPVR